MGAKKERENAKRRKRKERGFIKMKAKEKYQSPEGSVRKKKGIQCLKKIL